MAIPGRYGITTNTGTGALTLSAPADTNRPLPPDGTHWYHIMRYPTVGNRESTLWEEGKGVFAGGVLTRTAANVTLALVPGGNPVEQSGVLANLPAGDAYVVALVEPRLRGQTGGRITINADGEIIFDDTGLGGGATPGAHASSHVTGGTDAITPASIGAASTVALATHTGGTDPHGDRAYAAGIVSNLSGVTSAPSIPMASIVTDKTGAMSTATFKFTGASTKYLGHFRFSDAKRYVHIKLNAASNNNDDLMFFVKAEGFLYDGGMMISWYGGYSYAGTIYTHSVQSFGAGVLNAYRASDGALVIALDRLRSTYDEGMVGVYFETWIRSVQDAIDVAIVATSNTALGVF